MNEIITAAREAIREIEERLDRMKGVITGTPWVIECSPGFYLVADGDGYRGGSITGRVVCYTPERIDAAVQHIRDNSAGVFSSARKVDRRDALRTELAALNDLMARAEKLAATSEA